jgi:hypothetical protein
MFLNKVILSIMDPVIHVLMLHRFHHCMTDICTEMSALIFYNAALCRWIYFKATLSIIHQGVAVSSHHEVNKTNLTPSTILTLTKSCKQILYLCTVT